MGLIHISDEQYEHLAFVWGLHYDRKNKVIYGDRKGYPFLLYAPQDSAPLCFTILTSATSTLCPRIGKAEKKLLKDRAPALTTVGQRGSKIMAFCGNTFSGIDDTKKNVDSILNTLVSFMKEKEFVPCCENCKRQEHTQILMIEYDYKYLCPQCEKQIAAQGMQNLSSGKTARKNGIRDIICALVGAGGGIIFMTFLFMRASSILTFIVAGAALGAATISLGLCGDSRPRISIKIALAVILILAVFVGYNTGFILTLALGAEINVLAAALAYLGTILFDMIDIKVWTTYLIITYLAAIVSGFVAYRLASKKFDRYRGISYIGRDKSQQSNNTE